MPLKKKEIRVKMSLLHCRVFSTGKFELLHIEIITKRAQVSVTIAQWKYLFENKKWKEEINFKKWTEEFDSFGECFFIFPFQIYEVTEKNFFNFLCSIRKS